MYIALPALLLSLAITGCATVPVGTGQSTGSATTLSDRSDPFPAAPVATPDIGPRLVMPATGGAPVFAMPVGGNLYLPVTGGPTIIGIP